jgi:hypothetical protein
MVVTRARAWGTAVRGRDPEPDGVDRRLDVRAGPDRPTRVVDQRRQLVVADLRDRPSRTSPSV